MENRNLFLKVLEAVKSKIMVLANLVFGKNLFLIDGYLLIVTWQGNSLGSLSVRTLIPSMMAPFSWPKYLPKALSPNILMVRIPLQRPISRGFDKWHDLIYIYDLALQYVIMDLEKLLRFVIKVSDDSSSDYGDVEVIKKEWFRICFGRTTNRNCQCICRKEKITPRFLNNQLESDTIFWGMEVG